MNAAYLGNLNQETLPQDRGRAMYAFAGKAITVIQPYAAAIVFGGKNIENRSRRTHYRGPVAIHSSLKGYPDDLDFLQQSVRGGEHRLLGNMIKSGMRKHGIEQDPMLKGHIIGIGMLVDCLEKSVSPWFNRSIESNFGWVIEAVIPINPIPLIGQVGLWNCKFKYQLGA